jgi:hypothetical protein
LDFVNIMFARQVSQHVCPSTYISTYVCTLVSPFLLQCERCGQAEFSNVATEDLTVRQVRERMATFAAEVGIAADTFEADFASDEINGAMRDCQRRAVTCQVYSSPMFFINGAEVPGVSSGVSAACRALSPSLLLFLSLPLSLSASHCAGHRRRPAAVDAHIPV